MPGIKHIEATNQDTVESILQKLEGLDSWLLTGFPNTLEHAQDLHADLVLIPRLLQRQLTVYTLPLQLPPATTVCTIEVPPAAMRVAMSVVGADEQSLPGVASSRGGRRSQPGVS